MAMAPPDCCKTSYFETLAKLSVSKEASSVSRMRILCEFCGADCAVSLAKAAAAAEQDEDERRAASHEDETIYSTIVPPCAAPCNVCLVDRRGDYSRPPSDCRICVAKAAALHRIRQGGGGVHVTHRRRRHRRQDSVRGQAFSPVEE